MKGSDRTLSPPSHHRNIGSGSGAQSMASESGEPNVAPSGDRNDGSVSIEAVDFGTGGDAQIAGTVPVEKKRSREKLNETQKLLWEVWEEEDERWIDEHMDDDTSVDQDIGVEKEIIEAPDDLVLPLYRYQKEWLAWALKQEDSDVKGGILADETGMGKTLQAIALVLAKRKILGAVGVSSSPSSPAQVPAIKCTLVVCPVIAVSQWLNEILRFTTNGSTKVLVCHEAEREKLVHQFSDYDFVLTTYSTIESDYVMLPKEQLQNKSAEPTFHSIKWLRIILDESSRSKTTKAILALESSYKWALCGTLLQNHVDELHSMIRFLGIVRYSCYLCNDCNCRTLDHSGLGCMSCSHHCVRHFCWWNKNVAAPIKERKDPRAMVLLKRKILKNIMLWRTKAERTSELGLSPKIISLRWDTLDREEENYYTAMFKNSLKAFNTYAQQRDVRKYFCYRYIHLVRLRQAVDHPYLVVYSATNAPESGISLEASNKDSDNENACGICHGVAEDHVVTSCAHTFCKACLIDYTSSLGEVSCPCSKAITVDFSSTSSTSDTNTSLKGFRRSSILNKIQLDNFRISTKIEALREEIRLMIEMDGSAKGVVFSQFTSFLDLISYSLQQSGITCVQLVGSMSMAARDAAIKRFTEDPNCRIFLMGFKDGEKALNLTVASHVFLMDPGWDPAAERQAYDRIHRIGQYKPVRIVKFVMKNTIEENILHLREKKELTFEGPFGGSSEDLGKLSENELRYLFDPSHKKKSDIDATDSDSDDEP